MHDHLKLHDHVTQVRTLFVSDVHLGTCGCQVELFLDFLRCHEASTIYLVGDIIDGWRLRGSWYWPQAHNDVVQKLLRKVRKGVRVVYVPGNHDEFLRAYDGLSFGGVEIADRIVHTTAAGKRYLVMHGDQFDVVVRHARWLAYLGDWAYEAAGKRRAVPRQLPRRASGARQRQPSRNAETRALVTWPPRGSLRSVRCRTAELRETATHSATGFFEVGHAPSCNDG